MARLTLDVISAAHHISMRYLQKLFHIPVVGWIREPRLRQCGDLPPERLLTHRRERKCVQYGNTC